MSYTAAVDHLYALGHELAPVGRSAPRRKFDLAHMRVLTSALGDPQNTFPSILIAGTNGKGSTAATLASILTTAGYRTALYTSPHLIRVNERIQIDGQQIPDEDFARLYFQVDSTADRLVTEARLPHHPSFFEVLTALAFLYYAEQKIDIAILEVGLGGRLDATNIVDPLISIITDIALDHQDYLGTTIAEITREKAGILRPNGTLITLPQHPAANQAIGEAAANLNLRAISAAQFVPPTNPGTPGPDSGTLASNATTTLSPNHYTIALDNQPLEVHSPLAGHHQQRNIALAIAAAIELRNHASYNSPSTSNQNSYKITNANIEAGIRNTQWPGRLELLTFSGGPGILLDVAHNPAGAWALRAAITQLPDSQPRTLIFSCLRDKSLKEMTQILLPHFDASGSERPHDHILFAPIDNPRAASLEALVDAAQFLDIPAETAPSLAAALAQARAITPPNGLIIATGSVYLVGEIRRLALNEGRGHRMTPEQQQEGVIPTLREPKGKNTRIAPAPLIRPPFVMRWLTYLLLLPLITLATAGFGCISLLVGLWDKSGGQQHAIARAWAGTLLLLSLSPVKIIGTEKLHEHETAVYASNHLSYMDTPVLFAKLPFQFRILAKQSLWKIPFIGWHLNHSGQVPVDSKSPRSLIASLNRGVATLKQGLPLVLFPEGGRAADGQLQSMMSGCAYMALKAQVPLIPITLIGTYELLPIHTYSLNPRPLLVVIGDPISTVGLTTRDADALTQQLYQSISTTYMQHHTEQ